MTIWGEARCTNDSAGAGRCAFSLHGRGEMRESRPDRAERRRLPPVPRELYEDLLAQLLDRVDLRRGAGLGCGRGGGVAFAYGNSRR